MIAVADTSPINYLVLIGRVDVLPALFERVLLPCIVHRELQHPGSPQPVQDWARLLPSWCEMASPTEVNDNALKRLDPGERAAIQLAMSVSADFLLMDERDGRKAALAKRLPIVGTVGILEKASERGLVDFQDALRELDRTNIRLSAHLRASYLQRHTMP